MRCTLTVTHSGASTYTSKILMLASSLVCDTITSYGASCYADVATLFDAVTAGYF